VAAYRDLTHVNARQSRGRHDAARSDAKCRTST